MVSKLSPELKLLLQHMQVQPANVQDWPFPNRMYLLTGGNISISLNRDFIATIPKFAAIAVSPLALRGLIGKNATPQGKYINWNVRNLTPKGKESTTAAMKAFAFWLNTLCTPTPSSLCAPTVDAEIVLRKYLHDLEMDLYATPLVTKFVHNTMSPVYTLDQTKAIVKSCTKPDDPLLNKLGAALVDRMMAKGVSVHVKVWLKMFDTKDGVVAREVERVLRVDWGKVLIPATGYFNDFFCPTEVWDEVHAEHKEEN